MSLKELITDELEIGEGLYAMIITPEFIVKENKFYTRFKVKNIMEPISLYELDKTRLNINNINGRFYYTSSHLSKDTHSVIYFIAYLKSKLNGNNELILYNNAQFTSNTDAMYVVKQYIKDILFLRRKLERIYSEHLRAFKIYLDSRRSLRVFEDYIFSDYVYEYGPEMSYREHLLRYLYTHYINGKFTDGLQGNTFLCGVASKEFKTFFSDYYVLAMDRHIYPFMSVRLDSLMAKMYKGYVQIRNSEQCKIVPNGIYKLPDKKLRSIDKENDFVIVDFYNNNRFYFKGTSLPNDLKIKYMEYIKKGTKEYSFAEKIFKLQHL